METGFGPETGGEVMDEFEMVHARFLAPLEKARGFGMTPSKFKVALTHYRGERKG